MSELINKLVVPLSVILALIGVIFAWFSGSNYAKLLDDARRKSVEVNQVQLEQAVYQRLSQELLVYSSKQPAIDPVLQAFGLKQGPQQPAPQTTRPSTAPTTSAPRTR